MTSKLSEISAPAKAVGLANLRKSPIFDTGRAARGVSIIGGRRVRSVGLTESNETDTWRPIGSNAKVTVRRNGTRW